MGIMNSCIGYLRALVSMSNEVLDFYMHKTYLFDESLQEFTHTWHFIEGLKKVRSQHLYDQLLNVLHGHKTHLCCTKKHKAAQEMGDDELWIPLYLNDRSVGVLLLAAPSRKQFTQYDAYIASCVAEVVATGFPDKQNQSEFFDSLQFCMLHRKTFLAATPTLHDVLKAYLNRIVGQTDFPLFRTKVSANFRLVLSVPFERDFFELRFCLFSRGVDAQSKVNAIAFRKRVSDERIKKWVHSWAMFDKHPPRDIDARYSTLFRDVRSHVAVPCQYGSRLYGVLSVDSKAPVEFDPLIVKWLSIIAAQACPVIANAKAREELTIEQGYLKNVIDAVPDEILIINDSARIARMNRGKTTHFPDAMKKRYCYKAFEGRKSECSGCHTLRALRTGRSVKQALWRYTDRTRKTRYVELSAGRIEKSPEGEPQAVEIARDVTSREAMLKWFEGMQDLLLLAHTGRHKKPRSEDHCFPEQIWNLISSGLTEMGFRRHQVCICDRGLFVGKICRPKNSFKGRNFADFSLDPKMDIPSDILMRVSKLRPIRFSIDENQKRISYIPRREIQWNYLTCRLKCIPSSRVKYFSDTGIDSWTEILIGMAGNIYGKVSVDREAPKVDTVVGPPLEYDSAQEMAILACFGRFASVAVHVALEHADVVKMDEKETLLEYASTMAHEFTNLKLSTITNLEYIRQKTPSLLKESLDVSRFEQNSKLEFRRLFNQVRDSLFEANLLQQHRFTPHEKGLTTELAKQADAHGLECTNKEMDPFIVSRTHHLFLRLIKLSGSSQDISILGHLKVLANTLSKLDTAIDTYRTLATLHTNLTAKSLLETSTVPTDIEESVNAAVRILRVSSPSVAHIEVKRIGRKLPKVQSPPDSLRLVWINLIKNAVEATSGTKPISVQIFREGSYINVRIEDKGIGLPKRVIGLISEPVDMQVRLTAPYLGLKIVRKIVKAQAGSLEVVSSSPHGTILNVKIPIKPVRGEKV